jgi:hypothetical protein
MKGIPKKKDIEISSGERKPFSLISSGERKPFSLISSITSRQNASPRQNANLFFLTLFAKQVALHILLPSNPRESKSILLPYCIHA